MRGHSRSPCSCIVGFEKSGRLFLIPARYRESDVILVVPAFKVGTTPESYELKSVFVRFSIDKEKIRLQLAFQIITPFAGQRVRRPTMNSRSRARMESRSSTVRFRPGSWQTLFKSSLKVGVASIVLIDAGHK